MAISIILERITNLKFERKMNKKDIIDKHTNGNKINMKIFS